MRVTLDNGKYRAGEDHVLIEPVNHKRDGTAPLAVIAHGASTNAAGAADYRYGGQVVLDLVKAGFVALCIDADGPTAFARAGAITAMGQAKAYGQGPAVGARPGPIVVGGLSMGALTSLVYAVEHPADVAGVWGAIPAVDLMDIYTNNLVGYAPVISTAYGGAAAVAAQGPSRNVAARAAELVAPTILQAAPDDTVARWSRVQALVAGATADVEVTDLGNVGHDYTKPHLTSPQVVAFLADTVA